MQEGIVIKSTGSWYEVRISSGEIFMCRLRGKIRLDGLRTTNPIAVGDKVMFEKEYNKDTCVINKILPRFNLIVRKSVNLSKESHIIAANIDQAILVATIAQPRTSTGFMDRFLVTAEAYHIPVTIVFNKYDIYDDEQKIIANDLISTFEDIGYQSFVISAKSGLNCDRLADIMKDKLNLFSGHSGVGTGEADQNQGHYPQAGAGHERGVPSADGDAPTFGISVRPRPACRAGDGFVPPVGKRGYGCDPRQSLCAGQRGTWGGFCHGGYAGRRSGRGGG